MLANRPRWQPVSLPLLFCTLLAAAQAPKLDQQFQSAVAQYDAGHYPEAAAQLEKLVIESPRTFEIHELLGLVYASESQDAKALQQFETAVRLKPDSAAARTNYAAALTRSGKPELAAEQLRKALALEPNDFEANHDLGEFYIQADKIPEAIPFLEKSQQINPTDYNNSYNLAMAYYVAGHLDKARTLVQSLMAAKNTAELHNLLGQIDEKDGKFLPAEQELETAAHMEPSEQNLFDWASELLLHRTYDPAIQVFQQATLRYPQSPRLMIGLGMALYTQGKYDESVKALIAAADLDPADARCYLFLSRAYLSSPNQADDVIQRFKRYAELEPNNARAQYYYAMSLWKGKRSDEASIDLTQIESLLHTAIKLDPNYPDAHLQLGILYAQQRQFDKSLPEYTRALELDANLADAHYRLGQYYVHVGQKDRAQAEFDIYQRLQKQHLAEVDKERAEVQQFVVAQKVTKP